MTALTVTLDATTLGALDELATRTARSRENLVAEAIEDYVSVNAWQIEKIQAGLAAADAGDFASDSEVEHLRRKFAHAQ